MLRSWIITDPDSTVELEDAPRLPPITAGEMLKELYMDEMGLTADDVAKAMGVAVEHVQAIIDGRVRLTGEDALRLGHAFKNSGRFWMGLQSGYELEVAWRSLAEEDFDRLPTLVAA